MAKNIYGTNIIKGNVSLNYVSCYITKTELNYSNIFPNNFGGKPTARNGFVGYFHTFKGTGTLKMVDKVITVKENEIVFIRYRDLQQMLTENCEWEFYCHWFYLDNFNLDYDVVYPLAPLPHQRETTERIIRYLNNNDYYYLCRANGIGLTLLAELVSKLKSSPISGNTYYQNALRDVIFYINQNIAEPLTMQDLANRCNICEKHFRNLFVKKMGMPPKQYIIKTKLEKAAFLLTNSFGSVTEISDNLAFYSPAYFISTFKKYYNMTPTQYRKKYFKDLNDREKTEQE